MQKQNAAELAAVIAEFEDRLPGWWWSIGSCSVSRDASCGPDRTGPDADLLTDREFDEGFHHDGNGDIPNSLRIVLEYALDRRNAKRRAQTEKPRAAGAGGA